MAIEEPVGLDGREESRDARGVESIAVETGKAFCSCVSEDRFMIIEVWSSSGPVRSASSEPMHDGMDNSRRPPVWCVAQGALAGVERTS